MLSFNSDKEFFSFLMSTDLREGQFSENELHYMFKRFRDEFRKIEGMKKSLEYDLFNQQKKTDSYEAEIIKLKNDMHFLDCKNKVLLNKFKDGLSFWERLTGKIKY